LQNSVYSVNGPVVKIKDTKDFAMLEMVYHDFSSEEAIHYSDTISEFFKEGWRKYLGF